MKTSKVENAYSLGYCQGREHGIFEHDDYESMSEKEQDAYKMGYQYGVYDYCMIEDMKEQNEQ